jgi:ribosomal protein L12E/L44/L45/RPP1/RPP2
VRSVKKTASALEGVDTAEVDFEKEMLTITMKEGKALTKEDLETAFKDGKFKVTSFATAGDATEKKEEKEDPKEEEADGDSYNVGISGMG